MWTTDAGAENCNKSVCAFKAERVMKPQYNRLTIQKVNVLFWNGIPVNLLFRSNIVTQTVKTKKQNKKKPAYLYLSSLLVGFLLSVSAYKGWTQLWTLSFPKPQNKPLVCGQSW